MHKQQALEIAELYRNKVFQDYEIQSAFDAFVSAHFENQAKWKEKRLALLDRLSETQEMLKTRQDQWWKVCQDLDKAKAKIELLEGEGALQNAQAKIKDGYEAYERLLGEKRKDEARIKELENKMVNAVKNQELLNHKAKHYEMNWKECETKIAALEECLRKKDEALRACDDFRSHIYTNADHEFREGNLSAMLIKVRKALDLKPEVKP